MEEEKQLDQRQSWTYKYIGSADIDKLEYIMMDLEAFNELNHFHPEIYLEEIRKQFKDITTLRIFYSAEFKSFVLEPVQEG